MDWLPIRLVPGDDLRRSLELLVRDGALGAAMVVSGVGSLRVARLRYAGLDEPTTLEEDLELVSLAGSIAVNGAHLHAIVARVNGSVLAGHVAAGCIVRTTAELLLARLDGWHFERRDDAITGFAELSIERRGGDGSP